MIIVYPDYYNNFKCIATRCKHNCCIGWEIDIDSNTAEYYSSLADEIGKRIIKNIDWSTAPHFILGNNDRCPFLNDQNLCEIILSLGENGLCEICAEHPRFYNEYPDRIECGIGLCCEEAARLILGKKDLVRFVNSESIEQKSSIILIRDKIIDTLQNRRLTIEERFYDAFKIVGLPYYEINISKWIKQLLSLERLDNKWTYILKTTLENYQTANYKEFDNFMSLRTTEYEQFCIYFIFRHFAKAISKEDLVSRLRFVVLAYYILYTAGACIFSTTSDFSFETQIDIARMFSSEIEYSDENLNIILDELFN